MANIWTRLNTGLLLLLALGMIGLFALRAEGGPLDPPGAPASTDSVRLPGTPISAPTTISQPGHYYLTRSFQAVGTNGITITANYVSLDLGGFTISGTATNSGQTGVAASGYSNVVENGTVTNFQTGVSSTAFNSTVRRVRAISNSRGIDMTAAFARIEDCEASSNGETGILVRGPVGVVARCSVIGNGVSGVTLGFFGSGDGNVLESSQVVSNNEFDNASGAGVVIMSSGNTLKGNTIGGRLFDLRITTGSLNRLADNFCVGTGLISGAWDGFGNDNCGL